MMYSIHNILRLCSRRGVFLRLNYGTATNRNQNEANDEGKSTNKDLKQLYHEFKNKILFNSFLESDKLEQGELMYHVKTIKRAKDEQTRRFNETSLPPLPVALRYYVDKERLLQDENTEEITQPEKAFQLPFATTYQLKIDDVQHFTEPTINESVKQDSNQHSSNNFEQPEFDRSNIRRWMTNYEHFDDTTLANNLEEDEIDVEWSQYYGTPNPDIGISWVPCGGCGALLHCSDPAIPGYLPSELFVGRTDEELKRTECQRCHFLQEYNIALDVTVQPEEYANLLHSIRHVKSLVLLMVDLLDFPCSVWPGILDIIGKERPIFIVANKVDLLPGDSSGYLKRIEECLMTEINKTKLAEGNIKHVALISAKTGYGIENLITAMFNMWLYKGDVFVVGCTNVGKSSLFNALLHSDYCKVQAVDIVKRATVSRWPGTTLNLLKFPINRPSGWKMAGRMRRLRETAKQSKAEKEIQKIQLQGHKRTEPPALMGHIGRTFSDYTVRNEYTVEKQTQMMTLNEKHEVFARSKWFYDTPGVINPDQVLSLLTTEELLLTVPKNTIKPQTYYLQQGSTLLIGGLARVDLVECPEACRITVYCSEHLPLTVTRTTDAQEVYDTFLGTDLLAVPSGGTERLNNWPGLTKHISLVEFNGEGPKICCGDVVLSSIAWISLTVKKGSCCRLAAWTPQGKGIYRRFPSLLPYAINLKGKRVRDTPAYRLGKNYPG